MSKSYEIDTIAAIATAPGEGGLAVVRVSGPRAISIADNLFDGSRLKPSERKGPSLVYGRVTDTMKVIDECILLIMPAPKSYTTEDVVEFQCHGPTGLVTLLREGLDEILFESLLPLASVLGSAEVK